MAKQIIRKKHIGRPVDFTIVNRDGETSIANGRIEYVRRGIASIRYWLPYAYVEEGFVTYLEVNHPRIVAIY
ncbi:MAG TPA: hypothetical protein V6C65_36720 [Allocoleopsis sp.]